MGWGTDDEFEIDLTADAPDGMLPIRWVGPREPANETTNDSDNGAGTGHTNGNGNGHTADHGTVPARTRQLVPRVVTLASFMAQSPAPREITPLSPAPMLDLREPDEWRDTLQPITLRDVATSRGARFLTVVVVTVFAVLIASIVLLWQRVEEGKAGATPNEPEVSTVAGEELLQVKNRLNSVETRLGSFLDKTGTVVTSPPPSVLEYELAMLRACLIEFQHAIDAGVKRGGQFKYC